MHKIIIEATGRGSRGQRYRATYAGATLIESSLNPEFDSCRALVQNGITGKLEVWRQGGVVPAMTLDIERAAGLTTSETDERGLRIVRWRPFSEEDAPDAVLSGAVSARVVISDMVATPA
jgi:hypothetical protein